MEIIQSGMVWKAEVYTRAVQLIEFSISILIMASDDYENRTIKIKQLLCRIPFHNILVLSF